jgi:hypothetical protein
MRSLILIACFAMLAGTPGSVLAQGTGSLCDVT